MVKPRDRLLQLPETEPVCKAVEASLRRPAEDMYEPIAVVFHEPSLPNTPIYLLLDLQALLLAQSQILIAANQEMTRQKQATQNHLQQLQKEQQKVREYTQLLEAQQKRLKECDRLLEAQRARAKECDRLLETRQARANAPERLKEAPPRELERKLQSLSTTNQSLATVNQSLLTANQSLSSANQNLLSIGAVLSQKGREAFAATLEGMEKFARSAQQIAVVRCLFERELETVRGISDRVKQSSQKVRHLSVKAAIAASKSQAHGGFSQVAAEIGKLANYNLEASQQTDRAASRLLDRLQSLADFARSGTLAAREMVEKIEQMRLALADLEKHARAKQKASASETSEPVGVSPETLPSLKEALAEQLESATHALESSHHPEAEHSRSKQLAHRIQQVLQHQKP